MSLSRPYISARMHNQSLDVRESGQHSCRFGLSTFGWILRATAAHRSPGCSRDERPASSKYGQARGRGDTSPEFAHAG